MSNWFFEPVKHSQMPPSTKRTIFFSRSQSLRLLVPSRISMDIHGYPAGDQKSQGLAAAEKNRSFCWWGHLAVLHRFKKSIGHTDFLSRFWLYHRLFRSYISKSSFLKIEFGGSTYFHKHRILGRFFKKNMNIWFEHIKICSFSWRFRICDPNEPTYRLKIGL